MKRLLTLALLVGASASSFAQITQVQHKVGTSNTNANTVAVTVSATGSGNLIIVGVGGSSSQTVTGVSGGCSGSYLQVTGARATESGGRFSDVWYCASSSAGATTITVTFSAASTARKEGYVHEVSGMDTSSPVDTAAALSNIASCSAPCTGAADTTTNANDYIIGVFRTAGICNNTGAGGGFTNDDASSAGCAVHDIVSATGTYTPTYSMSSAGVGAASTVSFKAAGGAPATCAQSITLMGVGCQ